MKEMLNFITKLLGKALQRDVVPIKVCKQGMIHVRNVVLNTVNKIKRKKINK